MKTFLSLSLVLLVGVFMAACGGGSESQSATPPTDGLTAEQLEHGIGPISAFTPGPIDAAMVAFGDTTFTQKCSACHKMAERYVGPALGTITTTRSPAYIMNMMMNPEEMIQRHPEARALLAQFMTPMANQNLTEEEARAVLEFLRTQVAQ